MPLLTIDTSAPDFSLADQNGNIIKLSQFQGKWVLLYFYPRAMTPGCTTQACALRDAKTPISALNTVVLGVSPDEPDALKKFEAKDSLNFTLLSDPNHTTAEAYGTWQEKNMYGRKYMGMARVTYIISPEGKIAHVMPKVSPKTHLDKILAFLETQRKSNT